LAGLIEHRKRLHQQVEESQKQHEYLERQLHEMQPLANLGMAWAMTAHELNNLLTPVVNYSQLALQHREDTELSEKALKKAHRLSTQAGQILEKVMSLANQGSLEKQDCNLNALIADVFDCLARDFSKDNIKVVIDIDDRIQIFADPNSFRQIIMNLVLNAHHAMRDSGGSLKISAAKEAEWIRVEIKDTGCGITPEKLRNIFTPFYTDGKHNGNGLGLAYCRKVIESHGGCISAESEPGCGSCFKIRLPKSDT